MPADRSSEFRSNSRAEPQRKGVDAEIREKRLSGTKFVDRGTVGHLVCPHEVGGSGGI